MKFSIYRYHPEHDTAPSMQAMELDDALIKPGMMLLDALLLLKAQDESLTFRRSCGEGVCGSDGMNINGRNALACVTPLSELKTPIEVRPLTGVPVIRDLVVDLEPFYRQYRAVTPYLVNNDPEPEVEHRQSPAEREQLDGLYECILSPAAPRPARRSGGTRTSSWGRPRCCSPGGSWPTAATRRPTSGSPISTVPSSCSAATPS